MANLGGKRIATVAQPIVQRVQLATFTLQPHPALLFFIPLAIAMEQEKVAWPFAGILCIKLSYLLAGIGQQFGIVWLLLPR